MSDARDRARHVFCAQNLCAGLVHNAHRGECVAIVGMKNAPREGRACVEKDFCMYSFRSSLTGLV
jgi:hypothetical protein